MVTTADVKPGDTIVYDCYGESRTVIVENVEGDIKNGEPGFDGQYVGHDYGVWGYLSQITEINGRWVR